MYHNILQWTIWMHFLAEKWTFIPHDLHLNCLEMNCPVPQFFYAKGFDS